MTDAMDRAQKFAGPMTDGRTTWFGRLDAFAPHDEWEYRCVEGLRFEPILGCRTNADQWVQARRIWPGPADTVFVRRTETYDPAATPQPVTFAELHALIDTKAPGHAIPNAAARRDLATEVWRLLQPDEE